MCDDGLVGAKRKSDDVAHNSSSSHDGRDARAAEHDLLPPAKRMATAAGPGSQPSASAPGAVASLAPPASALSRFGFKASTPLKKPLAATLATDPAAAAVAVATTRASSGAITESNQSEHDAPRVPAATEVRTIRERSRDAR